MDFSNSLAEIGAGVVEARHRAGVEGEIWEDGRPYCKKCGEPLMLELKFSGAIAETLGATRFVPRDCECMRAMFAVEDAAEKKAKQQQAIEKARLEGLKEKKYRETSFALDDGRNPKIRRMCEQYVQKRGAMIEGNYGLAFIGNNGSGKTFWAACIANALIDAGASVYMIKLKSLIDAMTADYGESREVELRKIRTADFLILDDYGAERGTDFSLEQAFEVIDTRYNAKKPLIITANLTEEILNNPPNVNYGRSYQRIIELCPAIVRVDGNRRTEIAAQKRKEMAALLRGE